MSLKLHAEPIDLPPASGWRGAHNARDAWPMANLSPNWSGYTLERTTTGRPPPAPSINVMFAFGPPDLTASICQRFALDFGLCHIHVPSMLAHIHQDKDKEKLGLLHPLSLKAMLQNRKIPQAHLLVPSLVNVIKEKVEGRRGERMFVITGLNEDIPTVSLFMHRMADLSAIVFFCEREEKKEVMMFREASVKYFGEKAMEVGVRGGEERTYREFLGQIAERAVGRGVVVREMEVVVAKGEAMEVVVPEGEEEDVVMSGGERNWERIEDEEEAKKGNETMVKESEEKPEPRRLPLQKDSPQDGQDQV